MNTRFQSFKKYAFFFLIVAAGIAPELAFALPWEAPLEMIRISLTGTVAKAIGIIAMAIAGGMLAFGGELSEFAKRICMVVLALAVLLLANGLVATLFGV